MRSTIEISIHQRPEGPLYQLITNPQGQMPELSSDPALIRTREYLRKVLIGDGERAHCPFVAPIEDQNGYFVFIESGSPETIDLSSIVDRLVREHQHRSSRATYAGQDLDVTSVVAAFAHPDTMSEEFCRELDAVREASRLQILRQGLMLAQMHPFHAREAQSRTGQEHDESKYRASIPVFIVRRMHKPDKVFMRTEAEKEVYAGFFGPIS